MPYKLIAKRTRAPPNEPFRTFCVIIPASDFSNVTPPPNQSWGSAETFFDEVNSNEIASSSRIREQDLFRPIARQWHCSSYAWLSIVLGTFTDIFKSAIGVYLNAGM